LKDKSWKTRYIDIPDGFDPVGFNPKNDPNKGSDRVREQTGALNVRYGVFGPTGDFPPITKALQPNASVKLRSTAQWFDSGNWWATIEPPR
jgi:hypothetical protein